MLNRKSLFTGAVIIAITASLFVSCKKSSDDDSTPTPTTPTIPAAASIKATIAGVAWSATTMYAYIGSSGNAVILGGHASSPNDSIYIGFSPGSFTFGSNHGATCDVIISGVTYSTTSNAGNIIITDTVGRKMSGSFNFNASGKSVTNGTFTNVPFIVM